ncbi:MAG: flagellar basal body L-ring protein FlgH [Planctomycetales bacterium]|nr:flagellar basal body L-ring protein FlgH [Planctomycetales bacterium]
MKMLLLVAATAHGASAVGGNAMGQDSSLLHRRLRTAEQVPLRVEDCSLIYRQPKPLKKLQMHDLVTVVVSLNSRMLSEGDAESRKTASINAVLADWIGLDGLALRPDPQSAGDPKINGSVNSLFRAESDIETRNTLTFTIQAEVIDLRPNGNLVIEARQEVTENDETWEKSLTGIIRREDVNPDNTIESDKVADLQVFKRERGIVRDGYRHGWLLKIYDRFKPF